MRKITNSAALGELFRSTQQRIIEASQAVNQMKKLAVDNELGIDLPDTTADWKKIIVDMAIDQFGIALVKPSAVKHEVTVTLPRDDSVYQMPFYWVQEVFVEHDGKEHSATMEIGVSWRPESMSLVRYAFEYQY